MNDIVIGAIGGYEFSQIKNWVYSLNQTTFDGDRVMISYGSSDDVVSKLKENGFEVYEVSWDGWGRPLTGGNELITHSGLVNPENAHRLVHNLRFFHMTYLISLKEMVGSTID